VESTEYRVPGVDGGGRGYWAAKRQAGVERAEGATGGEEDGVGSWGQVGREEASRVLSARRRPGVEGGLRM
jgi:hypothetical protein